MTTRISGCLLAALWLAGCGGTELDLSEQPLSGELEAELGSEQAVFGRSVITGTGVKQLGSPMWAGKSANANVSDVQAKLRSQIAAGAVPYVFFYHWGDGPGRTMGDFQNATSSEIAAWESFGKMLAETIGQAPAYVVLEPEWDVNPPAAASAKFQEPMKRIIGRFRSLAPKTKLINGPGLWKPDSAYLPYKPVASLMDLQGFLLHVTSNASACTLRTDGSHFGGGSSLSEALTIEAKIRERARRVKTLFGGTRVMLTDLAVTRCSWGDEGQRQIFAKLASAVVSLYDSEGLRGVSIRNGGPSPAERYLGVNNEGTFDYVGHPAEAEVKRAVNLLAAHLSGSTPTSTVTPATTATTTSTTAPPPITTAAGWAPTFRLSPNINEWWIEVSVNGADSVMLLAPGSAPAKLEKKSWGSFAIVRPLPSGTLISLVAHRSGASASTRPFRFLMDAPVTQPGWAAPFALSPNVNGWWVEVRVDGAAKVEAMVGSRAFLTLEKKSWGSYAASVQVPSETPVLFRATRADGAVGYSRPYLWP